MLSRGGEGQQIHTLPTHPAILKPAGRTFTTGHLNVCQHSGRYRTSSASRAIKLAGFKQMGPKCDPP